MAGAGCATAPGTRAAAVDRAPWEREQLLRELITERFGARFRRVELKDPPKVIAARRRVLCGLDDEEPG